MPKDNWKQNSNGSYTRNIKTMLLVVIAINWYMLMINSVSLLNQTQVKMLFTILLTV